MNNYNNFQGLVEPLNTVWGDGRNVTVYPSGKVVNNSDGRIIRAETKVSNLDPIYNKDNSTGNVMYNKGKSSSPSAIDPNLLLIALAGIIIIGIIVVGKK